MAKKEIISCQNGKRFDVLNTNYGSLNRHTRLHQTRMNDIKCRSNSALQIVQEKCNGETSCELLVNNTVFGIKKTLKVKYKCLE